MNARLIFRPIVLIVAVVFAASACYAGATPPPTDAPTVPTAAAESPPTATAVAGSPCSCTCPPSAADEPSADGGSPAVPVAQVTLEGLPFFVRASDDQDIRRCQGLVVSAETMVDGRFLSASQCWDEGAVWWEDRTAWQTGEMSAAEAQWIILEFDGRYTLDGAIIQADNNDAYLLSYRDPDSGTWLPLWTVPPAYSFGMATRPDPLDDTKRQVLPKIVTTDAIRLEAEFGDGMYSVAEIQVFGVRAEP